MRYLLDVNVWVAVLSEEHVGHDRATAFLTDPDLKIAVCPLTENGVLRVMNTPALLGELPTDFAATKQAMQRVYQRRDTEFWPDDVSLVSDEIDWGRVTGHRQVPDLYLLRLAVAHGGRLATFDRRITHRAVVGAEPNHIHEL